MGDTWQDIQDFKSKHASLKEKLARRKKERQEVVDGILGSTIKDEKPIGMYQYTVHGVRTRNPVIWDHTPSRTVFFWLTRQDLHCIHTRNYNPGSCELNSTPVPANRQIRKPLTLTNG